MSFSPIIPTGTVAVPMNINGPFASVISHLDDASLALVRQIVREEIAAALSSSKEETTPVEEKVAAEGDQA